jgi:hypothetical protein
VFRIWEFVGKKYLIVDFVLSYVLNSFGTEILQNSVCEREEREEERVVSLGGSSESFLLELESFQWFVEFWGPSLFVCLFACLWSWRKCFMKSKNRVLGWRL